MRHTGSERWQRFQLHLAQHQHCALRAAFTPRSTHQSLGELLAIKAFFKGA